MPANLQLHGTLLYETTDTAYLKLSLVSPQQWNTHHWNASAMWQCSQVCHLEKSQTALNSILNSLPADLICKDKHESAEKHSHSAMHVEIETLGMTFDFSTKTKHSLKTRKSWKGGRGKAQQCNLGESHQLFCHQEKTAAFLPQVHNAAHKTVNW